MSTRSIYVVEDDGPVRMSLQSVFSTLPNTLVWGFQSGDAFLERAEELSPGCVLLDFHMPGLNGVEVLKRSEHYMDKFVFVLLTGHGEVSIAVQAMKAGAADFMEKPYDFATLMQAVEKAFSRLEHSSSGSARRKAAVAKLATLSARELDVLNGLINGESNKVIAKHLDISPRTVEIHRAKLAEKLEAQSLSDVLKIAFTGGLFSAG